MTCGIYCIRNRNTDQSYIGSSKNIERRWKQHVKELDSGCHQNTRLQMSWSLIGADNFVFIYIETTKPDELLEREQYYIQHMGTDNYLYGYNEIKAVAEKIKTPFRKPPVGYKKIWPKRKFAGSDIPRKKMS